MTGRRYGCLLVLLGLAAGGSERTGCGCGCAACASGGCQPLPPPQGAWPGCAFRRSSCSPPPFNCPIAPLQACRMRPATRPPPTLPREPTACSSWTGARAARVSQQGEGRPGTCHAALRRATLCRLSHRCACSDPLPSLCSLPEWPRLRVRGGPGLGLAGQPAWHVQAAASKPGDASSGWRCLHPPHPYHLPPACSQVGQQSSVLRGHCPDHQRWLVALCARDACCHKPRQPALVHQGKPQRALGLSLSQWACCSMPPGRHRWCPAWLPPPHAARILPLWDDPPSRLCSPAPSECAAS